ncbi:MAG: D-alanine--D-alanine ligase family protein [Muribaculaceae bacterium]|nr:D-alanine--D-alanine ligase family protein [Muribaculaceae bacterium]
MKTNVAVFFGGRSTEHEISVISANQAINALNADKYNVIPVYISKEGRWYTGQQLLDLKRYRDIPGLLKESDEVYFRPEYGDYNLYYAQPKGFMGKKNVAAKIDVVIPVLHGANGEDGTFEGILDSIGIPYAGCDTLSSANGMDKITMKMILCESGIPVVDYAWFTDRQWFADKDALIRNIEEKLGYPVIVKPANLGSSIGISCAHDRAQLEQSVADATKYASRILVEDMIEDMQEINCSVLGDCDEYQTSVLEEPIKSSEILSYDAKYMGGDKGAKGMQASAKKFPADLPEDETKYIQQLAGDTFRVLSCHGVSRVDVMIDKKDRKVYVNEINTIPGSLSFYLWEGTGIPFDQLMDRLVALAVKRNTRRAQKTFSFSSNIFAMGGGTKGAKGVKGAKA